MFIFIVCSFILDPDFSVLFFILFSLTNCNSFVLFKVQYKDDLQITSWSFSSLIPPCSSSVRQLFLYIAFLLENVCWIKFSIKMSALIGIGLNVMISNRARLLPTVNQCINLGNLEVLQNIHCPVKSCMDWKTRFTGNTLYIHRTHANHVYILQIVHITKDIDL